MPVLAFFVWLLIPSKESPRADDRVIDASDPSQIGALIGMMGGSVGDAAISQFALSRFEETHGRKATVKDMGLVAGMMSGLNE